jgi:hypothetical protein
MPVYRRTFFIEFSQIKQCHYFKEFYNTPCFQETDRKINLIDYFTDISIEEREGEYIPDIKLFNSETKEQLFIEIKVTHGSSFKKITSKYRIIEVVISNENDISCIQNRYIYENHKKIRFYNFKKVITDNCHGDCKTNHYFLWLSDYGKASMEERNLKQIKETIDKESKYIVKFQITENNYQYNFKIYKSFIMGCIKDGLFIKNCILCKYVGLNLPQIYENMSWKLPGKSGQYVSCSIQPNEEKKHCNYAVICPDFVLDDELLK